ncbi:MAG: hypothetical protein EOP83_07795 [Verrucomicrobiaceae bacterium]|nr:MAG: hypothetical protein EOP83_07795 [Verrucomicrobiaceae bacterium]
MIDDLRISTSDIDGHDIILSEFTEWVVVQPVHDLSTGKAQIEEKAAPIVEWLHVHAPGAILFWNVSIQEIDRVHPQQPKEIRFHQYVARIPDPDALFEFKMRWC